MSMMEMKEQITAFTVEQRLEIAALISHLNRRDDPGYRDELERRLTRMDAGYKSSQSEVEALHDRLNREGR